MVDVLNAMEMFEALGQAVKEAGNGKFNGFLMAEALRDRGYRLVLERLPITEGPMAATPAGEHLLRIDSVSAL